MMIKKIVAVIVMAGCSLPAFAGTNAGDVNFANYYAPASDTVKYQLEFSSDGAQTSWTACLAQVPFGDAPGNTLTIAAMGGHTGVAYVNAYDCMTQKTYSHISSTNYEPPSYYNFGCSIQSNNGTLCTTG